MRNNFEKEIKIQRDYYKSTALNYDKNHLQNSDFEHEMALAWLSGLIKTFSIKTILDIGSGTGRVITYLKEIYPEIKIIGIEPSQELREIGYKKGISKEILIRGDAMSLNFDDGEFDLVCEFATLHHIPCPEKAVSEMLRVSKKAIFISDCNNFGQGTFINRTFKQFINILGLWNIFNYFKTKGKGYTITAGDGLAYSYSVFNNYKIIRKQCSCINLLNTLDGGFNLYRTSPQIALFGLKK